MSDASKVVDANASKAVTDADAGPASKIDMSRIQWTETTSERGAKFQIGTLEPADPDATPDANEAQKNEVQKKAVNADVSHGVMPAFRDPIVHNVDVWWPVANDTWKKPAQQVVDKVDIKQYYVAKQHLSIYDWVVRIVNTQDWDYTFYDESGDGYNLTTWRKGEHYVNYNSAKPNIIRVRAQRD